jgi:hypothetical protein
MLSLAEQSYIPRELNEWVDGLFQLWTLPDDIESLGQSSRMFRGAPHICAGSRIIRHVSEISADFERATCDIFTGRACHEHGNEGGRRSQVGPN